MHEGIWLGVNGRTEEVFIGTPAGVVKCRTIKRLPEENRWDAKLLNTMQGTTWQPVPGYKSDHVPVEIDKEGKKSERQNEDDDAVEYQAIPLEEDVDRPNKEVKVRSSPITDIRVTSKDTDMYGCTPGCPACEFVLKNQKIGKGVAHSKECRHRIRELIAQDEEEKERVARADRRKVKHSAQVGNVAKLKGPRHLTKLQKEMHMQMLQTVAEGMDVAEIYSPPRVAVRAEAWGLRGGWSLDITTHDHDGKAWDLSKAEMRQRVIARINTDTPLLIIGSPMCTDWSSMMNLNWGKMTTEEKERRMKAARKHLRFCVRVYRHQVKEGRDYVHEHPAQARSWQEPEMKASSTWMVSTPSTFLPLAGEP